MKKNLKVLGIAGLAAVAVVGGTFAYFNQTSTIDNPFSTGKFGNITYEDFKPEDGENWKPGVEVNKKLEIANTGDQPIVVRVKFDDIWSRDGEEFKTVTGNDATTVKQADAADGLTAADKSVVEKKLEAGGWTEGSDGYWYFNEQLAAGKSTGTFLSSVVLDKDTDMGKYIEKTYFTKEEVKPADFGDWSVLGENETLPKDVRHTAKVTEVETDFAGYSAANYTLRITTQTVQATDAAVKEVFAGAPESVVTGWKLTTEKLATK